MPYKTDYISGDYNFWCPVCTGTTKRSSARMRWDNVLVCEKCWDPKHPQDGVVRSPKGEGGPVPTPRIEPDDVFASGTEEDL